MEFYYINFFLLRWVENDVVRFYVLVYVVGGFVLEVFLDFVGLDDVGVCYCFIEVVKDW